MALHSSFFRDDFQLKENSFTLQRKRALTICNLFINHKMSISNIQGVLDEDPGKIVQVLIQRGIIYDRRQIAGRPPVGVERRITRHTRSA
jgi:hypothetical protein